MHTIVYTSREARFLPDEEINGLLEKARSFNQGNEITGILLYFDLVFFQVLEGPKQALEALFERIAKDPRHKNVTVHLNEAADERLFSDWSMAFRKLDGEVIKDDQQVTHIFGFDGNNSSNVVNLSQQRLQRLVQNVAGSMGL